MLRALIVDDEKNSRETLANLLTEYCPEVEITGMADAAASAREAIHEQHPDLVFLDVEMPKGSGFDLLESLESINFEIIFTTAYDQYAIRAIKVAALDYLLKPINIRELKNAVAKAVEKLKEKPAANGVDVLLNNIKNKNNKLDRIALPTTDGLIFIRINEIIRCEASDYYTYFFLTDRQKILVSKTLKEYDELLSANDFLRVHHSHLINLNQVRQYFRDGGGYLQMTDGSKVEISRRRKDAFLNKWRP